MAKSKEVYVYVDLDHSDVQVFTEFEKAQYYLILQWGHNPEWEECKNSWHDLASDYVTIYKREIQ